MDQLKKWKEEFHKEFALTNCVDYSDAHGFADHEVNLLWLGFKAAKRSQTVVELPNVEHIIFDTKLQEKGFSAAIEYVGEILEERGIQYRMKGE